MILFDLVMLIEQLSPKYISYVANIIKDRWKISEAETESEIKRWISNDDDSICFVGIINDNPMAFGLFDVQSKVDPSLHAWNRQLWVEPKYRGCDYGHKLTEERFLWAKNKGYNHVYLSTEAAKEYHSKYGWQVVREEIKDGIVITLMKYNLI